MKTIFLIIFAITLFVGIESCESFMDCGHDECCKDVAGVSKTCLSLRDEGDTCGGKFLCDCKLGYTCKQREESVWNTFKVGTGHCTSIVDGIKGMISK